MQSVEQYVMEKVNELDAIQMIEAIRDKFLNVALVGYGVCYYAKIIKLKN